MEDIIAEKLYIFAFFAQLVIVMGILYAALLYTTVAAPETSTFVQNQRPRFGVVGSDPEVTAELEKDLEVLKISGNPEDLIRDFNLVGVLYINSEKDFEVYLDNTKLLSGYADTIVTDVLSTRSAKLRRDRLEAKMETADVVLNPIRLKERLNGEKSEGGYSAEFIVIMYGLLIPFMLLLPTFLATNMVTDSIVGEKERKTYEILISSPITKRGIVLSKILPILLVALGQSIIWMGILRYKGLPIYNIKFLIVLLLIINLIFIGIGVLISAVSDTLKESNLSVTISLLFTSLLMFAPLYLKSKLQYINPIKLITKLSSNPVVPADDMLPLLPLSVLAVFVLLMGEYTLKKRETLRL